MLACLHLQPYQLSHDHGFRFFPHDPHFVTATPNMLLHLLLDIMDYEVLLNLSTCRHAE
jgi:hypothetical protein